MVLLLLLLLDSCAVVRVVKVAMSIARRPAHGGVRVGGGEARVGARQPEAAEGRTAQGQAHQVLPAAGEGGAARAAVAAGQPARLLRQRLLAFDHLA